MVMKKLYGNNYDHIMIDYETAVDKVLKIIKDKKE